MRNIINYNSWVNRVKKKILIVEDNIVLYETIRGYLDHMYEITHAETGEQAMALLSEKPDLVLLDLNLPDTHGLQMIEKIKKTGVIIVVLTGEVKSESVVEAVQKGANDYIAKPVSPILLKSSIAKHLSD